MLFIPQHLHLQCLIILLFIQIVIWDATNCDVSGVWKLNKHVFHRAVEQLLSIIIDYPRIENKQLSTQQLPASITKPIYFPHD